MAKAFESFLETINIKADEVIVEKKNITKIELKEELKNELVTREFFQERFKVIEERFNSLNFKLNIFIIIALLSLTLANPTFTELLKRLL